MNQTNRAAQHGDYRPDRSQPAGALTGLLALDLSEGVAGRFCSRLLADNGVNVISVQLPPGASGLQFPPSHLWVAKHRHLNTSKVVLEANWREPEGFAQLKQHISSADIVIYEDPGLDAIIPANPNQIACRIRDFADEGPYALWQGTEMIHQALSGTAFVTGEIERKPLFGLGQRSYYAAGVSAYNAILAALLVRETTGLGQFTTIAVHETAAAMGQNFSTQYRYSGGMQRRGRYPTPLSTLRCQDGWVVLFALRRWPAICEVFGAPELLDDPRFADVTERMRHWKEAEALLQDKASLLSSEELMTAGQAQKVSISRILSPQDLLSCKHLQARNYWTLTDTNELVLGSPFRMSRTPLGTPRAPKPIRQSWSPNVASRSEATVVRTNTPDGITPWHGSRTLPLAGIRVLDFTIAWAGPMATRILSFLGAEVIKIEGPTKLDSWRGPVNGANPDRYPGNIFGNQPYNRSCYFNTQNHDKMSVGINLKKPEGRGLALGLAALSNVVIANFSPGTLTRLGLGYEHIRAVNPEVVMLEMPAYGNDGPYAHHVGMGQNIEAMSGMAALFGYDDQSPTLSGSAFLDPAGGFHGAAAVLTALYHHSRTGEGQYVELAQREAAMHWIGELLLESADKQAAYRSVGNSAWDAAPHDLFACRGDDEWIALAIYSDDQFVTATEVLGGQHLVNDARFANRDSRVRNARQLYGELSLLTQRWDKHELASVLQERGVAAAPVNNGKDVALDPQLAASGFFVPLNHPATGEHEYPGLPIRLSATPGRIGSPSPCFGQHTYEVLHDLLNLDLNEIEHLRELGVVAIEPDTSAAF